MVEKLAEILHELVNAAKAVLSDNRVGELHGLVDELVAPAEAPAEPETPADGAPAA